MIDLVNLLTVADYGNEVQESFKARRIAFREIVRPSFGKSDEQIDLAATFCALVVEFILLRRMWPFSPAVWVGHPPSAALLRDTARSMPGIGKAEGDAETGRIRQMRFRLLFQSALRDPRLKLTDAQEWAVQRLRDATTANQSAAMHAIVSTMPDPRLS